MSRRVTVREFLCRNACFLSGFSVFAHVVFVLWLFIWSLTCCCTESRSSRTHVMCPAWRTGTGSYTEIDTQMLQPVISPETVAALQYIDFLELKAPITGIYRTFRVRHCSETTLFEQLRAVPLQCQVQSCLLIIFHCGWCNSWLKSTHTCFFSSAITGRE